MSITHIRVVHPKRRRNGKSAWIAAEIPPLVMSVEIIVAIIFFILLVVDIAGNTLVILVILKYRTMKTPINYLLLNIAVADILVGLFFSPSSNIFQFFNHPSGKVGDFLCQFLTGRNVAWVASLVSAFLLMCVGFERFYAVVHPTSVRRRITTRTVKRIVPACWIVAIVHTIPSFISKHFDDKTHVCTERYAEKWQFVSYWFMWLFTAGILPLCVMGYLYVRVIHSLWLRDSRNGSCFFVVNARKRLTMKCITVSVIYALFVLPTHFHAFISLFRSELSAFYGSALFYTLHCLVLLNSVVNPFAYALQCDKFRKHLKRLFRCSHNCSIAHLSLHQKFEPCRGVYRTQETRL